MVGGGGVALFISDNIPFKRHQDLENLAFECMWVWLRPHRLQRPLSGIITAVVYCPLDKSAQDWRDLVTYLSDTIDIIRFRYPDCGIVILGDFNGLDTSELLSSHGLKQLVSNPTRVGATLDLILSNLQPFYAPTSILAPLGTPDHNIVKWGPSTRSNGCHNKVKNRNSTCLVRRYPRTARESFGRWIIKQDWSHNVSAHPYSANELDSSFTQKISQAMEIFFPTSVVKSHYSDKPWMTSSIKKLIAKR